MAAAYLFNPISYIIQRCTKVAQPSRQMAQRAVRAQRRANDLSAHGAGVLNAYRCGICGAWHVGHKGK